MHCSLLDRLPPDVVRNVLLYTDDRDLFAMGCTSRLLRSLVAPILEKRIFEHSRDGSRVLIALESTAPSEVDGLADEKEMSLLGIFQRINPETLDLILEVETLDKDGFNTIEGPNSFILYNVMAMVTHLEIHVFMAKVSDDPQRIKYIHPLGFTEMDIFDISEEHSQQIAKINEGFRIHYHLREPDAFEMANMTDAELQPIILEIDQIQISASWWLYQTENNYSQTW